MSGTLQGTLSSEGVVQLLIGALFQGSLARGPNERALWTALQHWGVAHLDRLIPPDVPTSLDVRGLVADMLTQLSTPDADLEDARVAAIAWLRESPAPPQPPPAPDPETGTVALYTMGALPDELRQAGFAGRDNALWYTFSRSVAGWPWDPGDDPEGIALKRREDELRAYGDQRVAAMVARLERSPALHSVLITDDGPDRCGDVLGEYTMRAIPSALADRVALGEVYRG